MGPVTLISAYAPLLSSPGEAKDKSYDELVTSIKGIPEKKLLFILGDLNARVGDDQSLACLAQCGTRKMNENDKCLLELCCHHRPCFGNTLFNTKPEHWIGDTQDLSTGTSLTWSSADALVFQASRSGAVFRVLIAIRPRIVNSRLRKQAKMEGFASALEESLPGPPDANACDRWKHFFDAHLLCK